MEPQTLILEAVIEMLDEQSLLCDEFDDRNSRWLAAKWRILERIKEIITTHE